VKKDLFGNWNKEESVTSYDDVRQKAEGRIILERMASIIMTDEAKKKIHREDLSRSPEGLTGDSHAAIEEPKAKAQEVTLNSDTSVEHLLIIKDSGTEIPSLKVGRSIASSRIEANTAGFRTKPESPEMGFSPEEISSAPSTCFKKKEAPLILVVEDEPVTQRLLKKILEDRGYEVSIAGDGIDALMELGKRHFNLILSDLSMPNLDGFKLLDFINMKGIQMPIIFLTGSDDVEDEIKVLALGAKDYIRKPINRDLLLLRVSKVLTTS
jgi:CheY-like chemotaxis protein